jgi:hypothetical protein
MRSAFSYAAFSLALAAGGSAARAQTFITPQPAPALVAQPPLVGAPAVQPAETVHTTRTVRTVRTLVPVRRQIVTTRTVTQQALPTAPAVVGGAAAPQPLYDVTAPAVTPAGDFYGAPAYGDYSYPAPAPAPPAYGYSYSAPAPAYDYSEPLYNVAPAAVAPAPAVAAPAAVAPGPVVGALPLATQPVIYRYVYEPDRILVIDPITNIAVQAIPR